MEKEISEIYHFNPDDFDERGRRKADGKTFRDVVKDFEYAFHGSHSTEYALNFYSNSQTMRLLAKSNDAAPFLAYGMDLFEGNAFDAEKDAYANHQMDLRSKNILVYGIDSAYMTEFDEFGYPVFGKEKGIFPLTLLIDETMSDGVVRLATPTSDDDGELAPVTNNVPQKEYL